MKMAKTNPLLAGVIYGTMFAFLTSGEVFVSIFFGGSIACYIHYQAKKYSLQSSQAQYNKRSIYFILR
jgi:hypothetical protein